MKNLQIALVHDYLQEFGGAERVILAMHQAFPQAPLYTAFADLPSLGAFADQFAAMDIKQTWLARMPGIKSFRSPYRIFAPAAFKSLDLSAFDVVISSSNVYHAKSLRLPSTAVHICYCHTPGRSLYGFDDRADYRHRPVMHFLGQVANHFLRQEDFAAAQQVDHILVNSQVVADRVRRFWRRESEILYPPVSIVDTAPAAPPASARDTFLYVNRLYAAKHPELAVKAALNLRLPLTVVGTGPLEPHLRALAAGHDHIRFAGAIDDDQLRALYGRALALIYPVADEDFGIVPVEAMACGTPVLAHRSGGPLETIKDGTTGLFFDDLTADAVCASVRLFRRRSWDPAAIQAHAATFSQGHFVAQLRAIVATQYAKKH